MSTSPLVSVIIPNWNGAALLPACLDSLRAQTYRRLEIIVVDNASTDESVALVRERYPEVRLVVLSENRGLTGGVNAGIRSATGGIIALLNNDAEAEPGWVAALVETLEAHPEAGSAASKMLLHDRRDVLNSAGDTYRLEGIPGNRGVWERDVGQYDRDIEVFGACGGAAAYRRAMLEEIGLFDEELFMYCEDVDLAWRAQIAGYHCVFAPQARVYHRLSATGGGPLASFYTGRNTLLVIAKDYPPALLQRYWPLVLRAQLRIAWEALRAWRGEAARARLRGQLAGLRLFRRWTRKRADVYRLRRVSDAELEALLRRR
ncbi:MAG: glycosyltransferase family 2 protein [Anaerolineae bacterium]